MHFCTLYGHAPLPSEEELEHAWLKKEKQFSILIGYAKEETSFFLPQMKFLHTITRIPFAGSLIKKQLIHTTTKMVYGNASREFAMRHAQGGGSSYLYNLHWGSKTNGFGATHTIDLPLLLGKMETWKNAELVKGINWKEVKEKGKMIRGLWAEFARIGHITNTGIDPEVISIRKMS